MAAAATCSSTFFQSVKMSQADVMPWQTNLVWKHAVPHLARYRGRRLSVTIRAFQQW